MNSTTTLAERLVHVRTMRGLTQEALAEQAGLAQPSYSELERGISKRSSYIATLARVLGVSAYWLETGLGAPDDADGLSIEERAVINVMRQMKPTKRKAFFDFVTLGNAK